MDPFTGKRSLSVASLGEERLIAAIRAWLGAASPPSPRGVGDDCAVLPVRPDRGLITVDPVVYGFHFDASMRPAEVGAKLLKRNVSDIAAMGGRPTAAVVSLILDPRTKRAWVEAFYRGLALCARRHRIQIVGGDVATGPKGCLSASLTLLGASRRRALTRTGARPGDWICVTGVLGGSLRSGHHLSFSPRLEEGRWLAGRREVRSLIDLSDGLAKDLRALAPDGCHPALVAADLPRRPGASLAQALAEGEDYELAFTLAARADWPAFASAWRRRFPRLRLSRIGRFVPAGKLPAEALDLSAFRGYEHLTRNTGVCVPGGPRGRPPRASLRDGATVAAAAALRAPLPGPPFGHGLEARAPFGRTR